MPTLYMIRHGLAGEHGTYANDDERPLTEEGHRKTKQVAKRLKELEVSFDLIQTSPLVRAHQTAEILQKVGLGDRLEVTEHLSPSGKIEDWLLWFEQWRQTGEACLAIVGHEPNLSAWMETLVWGEVRGNVTLKKAGVMGLTLPDSGSPVGNSSLFWLTPPRFLV